MPRSIAGKYPRPLCAEFPLSKTCLHFPTCWSQQGQDRTVPMQHLAHRVKDQANDSGYQPLVSAESQLRQVSNNMYWLIHGNLHPAVRLQCLQACTQHSTPTQQPRLWRVCPLVRCLLNGASQYAIHPAAVSAQPFCR